MSQEQPFLQQVKNTANVTLDVLLNNLTANISTAYTQANSSYSQANTATTYAEGAWATANSGVTISEQAYAAANNSILIGEEAYAAANNGILIGEESYNAANIAYTHGTNAWNAANSAAAAAAAAQTTANEGIAPSGVSPGTYGSGVAIPVITVDTRGRVLTATTASLATFTPTQSGVVPASGGGTANFLNASGAFASVLASVITSKNYSNPGSITIGDFIINFGTINIVNGANINCIFATPFSTTMFGIHFTTITQYGEIYPTSLRMSGSNIVGVNYNAGINATAYYFAIGY